VKEINSNDIEKINAELAELFESDVKEFSENGAKAFGHILAKHGIDNPQQWLEGKMREDKDPSTPTYFYTGGMAGFVDPETKKIGFGSPEFYRIKFTRAHEMAHKIMSVNDGLFYEGLTDCIAEKLLGVKYPLVKLPYFRFTHLVKQVVALAGEDCAFETAIFNSPTLENEWHKLTKDRHSFAKITHSLDECRRIFFERGGKKAQKHALNQALREVQRCMSVGKKAKFLVEGKYVFIMRKLNRRLSSLHYSLLRVPQIIKNQNNYQFDSIQNDSIQRKSQKQVLQGLYAVFRPENNTEKPPQQKKGMG
jgi:hypothetical protein